MLAGETHPDAIVALSEPSTRGAFFALMESNRIGKMPLIGFDQNVLAPIRTGEIDSVIILNTFEMGRAAIKLISDERARQSTQTHVVLEPELVTRETIDSPRVREALDLDWFRQ
jgi:ribose transport system substrate-binding protein